MERLPLQVSHRKHWLIFSFSNLMSYNSLISSLLAMDAHGHLPHGRIAKSESSCSLDPLEPPGDASWSAYTHFNHHFYKTELCRNWEQLGYCHYGLKCQFAHGQRELRHRERHPKYKTRVCRNYICYGRCPYGERCTFIHPPSSIPSLSVPTVSTLFPVVPQQQQRPPFLSNSSGSSIGGGGNMPAPGYDSIWVMSAPDICPVLFI